MLLFITGVPGSGKTYYSLYKIYTDFIKSDTHYDYLYTNIAMFKFGISPKFREFKNDIFLERISILYDLYKNNVTEVELIEKSKELEIFNSFFVIDEAHNFFDKERPELVFFLTYHRHFNCDLYLISQNLLLIHYKYRYLAEYFVKAKNRSIALSSNVFSYNYFADDKFQDRLESVTLPKRKEVFELYKSGDVVRSKNFLNKFFIYIFILLFLAIVIFYFLIHYFFTPQKKSNLNKISNVTHSEINLSVSKRLHSNSSQFYYYSCFGKYCIIDDYPISIYTLKIYHVTFLKSGNRFFVRSSKNLDFLVRSFKKVNKNENDKNLTFFNYFKSKS